MARYLIAGAGLAGAVLARELAESGAQVVVRDERDHVAGNCHTERDLETGVMVHRYGPHIFNTNSEEAWDYVNRFTPFRPFINRVKAVTHKGVFSLPVNLHTINQFFNEAFSPAEAKAFVEGLGDDIPEPANFEEQGRKLLGSALYESFFDGYTRKQWGCEPSELPASVLKRLPVRFNYDDNYYNAKYQGMPEQGYTAMVQAILEHPNIQVELGCSVAPQDAEGFDHLFWSGPLDQYFDCQLGKLGYRTVYWTEERSQGDALGNAVLNYPDMSVPFTRKHEHKHFTPWEQHEQTIVFTEFSKATEEGDIPYYPVNRPADKALFRRYVELAKGCDGVSFIGRLGSYRYLNMDLVILETLAFARAFLNDPSLTFPPAVEEMLAQ
ncbi:UDP-galactopyranose/dTDP-fucopyranose mutase family protein [Gallaecimonas xiamenensis]|uniref:UDP-galactopyranose mutase n=1 Tax=Gallaecimonas xiamenensis 3-C-1 TaxID=745411 RepID=K2JSH5_9GAMM|nr:UDP-galactopyranose mutase [Gallaecimonas xiamenensis]EKE77462.1 UDP-galactopyranose mutase [Gallaecimonas xiamenensis 3-C-1]